jgi:protein-disulfide isomerase
LGAAKAADSGVSLSAVAVARLANSFFGRPHGPASLEGYHIVSAKVQPKKSGNSGFILALVGVVLAGGGAIWWKSQQPAAGPAVAMPASSDSVLAAKARGYTLGEATAPVEIVEFADFECPACGRYATITEPDVRKNLVETGKVRYTFYDFPLNIHKNTIPASMAAACADDQGKFWPMHDAIFLGQIEWSGEVTDNPRAIFTKYAQSVGLDMPKWNGCMDTNAHAERIRANYALGLTKRVPSTPTFLVNGEPMQARSNSYDEIVAAVNAAAAATLPIPTVAPEAVRELGGPKK